MISNSPQPIRLFVVNILNSLATIAIATHIGIPFETVAKGLAGFGGVKRRFEIKYQNTQHRLAVVDDYGHHPTEIAATLQSARQFWKGRILTVFQPHRYSRTLHCHEEFMGAFEGTHLLRIADIYSAGEAPIPGITAESLAQDIAEHAPTIQVRACGGIPGLAQKILAEIQDGDLILCLGAGSITKLAEELTLALREKWPGEVTPA